MNYDINLLLWIQEVFVKENLTPVFRFITTLGNSGGIWIALAVVLLLFKKTRKIGIMVSIALIGSYLVTNLALKNIAERIRPYEIYDQVMLLIDKQDEFSFPSGHASASFAAAIATMRGLTEEKLKDKYKVIYYAVFVLALLIAFSRLYLGVHYPTDVVFGIVIGSIIGSLVWKLPFRKKDINIRRRDK